MRKRRVDNAMDPVHLGRWLAYRPGGARVRPNSETSRHNVAKNQVAFVDASAAWEASSIRRPRSRDQVSSDYNSLAGLGLHGLLSRGPDLKLRGPRERGLPSRSLATIGEKYRRLEVCYLRCGLDRAKRAQVAGVDQIRHLSRHATRNRSLVDSHASVGQPASRQRRAHAACKAASQIDGTDAEPRDSHHELPSLNVIGRRDEEGRSVGWRYDDGRQRERQRPETQTRRVAGEHP
jgi:hypothetical protein